MSHRYYLIKMEFATELQCEHGTDDDDDSRDK